VQTTPCTGRHGLKAGDIACHSATFEASAILTSTTRVRDPNPSKRTQFQHPQHRGYTQSLTGGTGAVQKMDKNSDRRYAYATRCWREREGAVMQTNNSASAKRVAAIYPLCLAAYGSTAFCTRLHQCCWPSRNQFSSNWAMAIQPIEPEALFSTGSLQLGALLQHSPEYAVRVSTQFLRCIVLCNLAVVQH